MTALAPWRAGLLGALLALPAALSQAQQEQDAAGQAPGEPPAHAALPTVTVTGSSLDFCCRSGWRTPGSSTRSCAVIVEIRAIVAVTSSRRSRRST